MSPCLSLSLSLPPPDNRRGCHWLGWTCGFLAGGLAGLNEGPWRPYPPAPTSSFPRPGTEFEYTDSEGEVKVPKQPPAGLLRPKKGVGEPGQSVAAPVPGARASSSTSPDKTKLASEKGRKARKIRGPKEPGFEAGPEASDDDLWTRRRSERIFLHDASAAVQAPSNTTPAPKPSRCGKGGAPSPRKDTGRAKDRKDPRKVRAQHRYPGLHPVALMLAVCPREVPPCLMVRKSLVSPPLHPSSKNNMLKM